MKSDTPSPGFETAVLSDAEWGRIRHHARSVFSCGTHSVHGPEHWSRVEANGLELCRETGADTTVVRLFAILHDACRFDDGRDPEHGPRAADMLASVTGTLVPIDAHRLAILEQAIRHHTDGRTSSDPTIGTCWDADRLDLSRVGIRPVSRFMSTAAGRRRVETP